MKCKNLSKQWIKEKESEHIVGCENSWAVDYVTDITLDQKYDELWNFIKSTCVETMSDRIVSLFAAGPVEDLLAYAGKEFIEDVEELAKTEPRFGQVLGGVWKTSIPDDVWKRLQSVANREGWV